MNRKIETEIIALDTARKWEYLRAYYKSAANFYDIADAAVDGDEIDLCLANFKRPPRPEIRKEIALSEWKFVPDYDGAGIKEGYFLRDSDEAGWEDVTVPHAFGHVPDDPVLFGRTRYRTNAEFRWMMFTKRSASEPSK